MFIAFAGLKGLPYPGGIETYTEEVGWRLARKGHQVRVYCPRLERADDYRGMQRKPVPAPPRWSPLARLSTTLRATLGAVRHPRPDILHVHSIGFFAPISKLAGITTVVQIHSREWKKANYGSIGRHLLSLNRRAVCSFADATVVVSPLLVPEFHRHSCPVALIPPGQTRALREPAGELAAFQLEPRSYILSVGRLAPEKDPLTLLRAYAALPPTRMKLVLVGPVPESPYGREVRKLASAHPGVILTGSLRGRPLDVLYSHALCYVQPSLNEGWCISLAHAMAYSLPVVASQIPENTAVVGSAGQYFPPGDSAALAAILGSLASDERAFDRYTLLSRRRAGALPGWDEVVQRLEHLYRSLLTGESLPEQAMSAASTL